MKYPTKEQIKQMSSDDRVKLKITMTDKLITIFEDIDDAIKEFDESLEKSRRILEKHKY